VQAGASKAMQVWAWIRDYVLTNFVVGVLAGLFVSWILWVGSRYRNRSSDGFTALAAQHLEQE
jgi:hypothetical protein